MNRRQFAVTAAAGLTACGRTHGLAQASDAVVVTDPLSGLASGPWRRLFLDGTVVEQQEGLERVFHSADKHVGNPVIVADRPWEGSSAITGPYVYGTVLHEGGKFRIWYQLIFRGNHIGYAESTDGLHWTKPDLEVIAYEGRRTNLVVSEFDRDRVGGICHNASVLPLIGLTDESRRYALYGFDTERGVPRVAFSPDGLQWRFPKMDAPQGLFSSSDVVNFMHDPYQRQYIATWKTKNRAGRAVGIATSVDGIEWRKPYDGPVFGADDLDPDTTQIYGMPIFPYQGLYIGMPWVYRARYFRHGEYSVARMHEAQADSPRTMDVQLAWSWNLMSWTRPPLRDPFIVRGDAGTWDDGMIVTARAPVQIGDDLYFYFGGMDNVHDEKRANAAIGLAKLRVDGFCSMRTRAGELGWLVSRREPMSHPWVTVNARCMAGGSIRAELLDKRNRVLTNFGRDDCIPFSGDSVKHELRWNTREFGESQALEDYKIRFIVDRAELFSYLPVTSPACT